MWTIAVFGKKKLRIQISGYVWTGPEKSTKDCIMGIIVLFSWYCFPNRGRSQGNLTQIHVNVKLRRNGQQKRATCFATLPQNELKSDLLPDRFDVFGKTRNIALQLVLQQCYKTSCMFFVPRFCVPLSGMKAVFSLRLNILISLPPPVTRFFTL